MSNEKTPTATPSRTHSREFKRAARTHGQRGDDGTAFVTDPAVKRGPARDDLAEELAESFVGAATSGEDVAEDLGEADVPEEIGGPFLEVSAQREFARDVDASNPVDAEPAAMPTANAVKR